MTDARASQVSAEALVQPSGVTRRVDQLSVEALVQPTAVQRRASQIALEVLLREIPSVLVAGEAFTVSNTALDGTPLVGIGVPGEAFTVTATAGNGQTNLPIKVAGSAFTVTATAGAGVILGTAVIVPGDAFVVTSTALDGTPPVTVENVAASVDTFNRSNGRRRTGISYATVTYAPAVPPTHIVPAPVRIMAQQTSQPNLVNGRPA